MINGNQWNNMEALRREIDRAFTQFGGRPESVFPTAFLPSRAARHYPLLNLHEDGDTLYVEALAPGLEPASLELTVVDHTLAA